jgi:hypothetical protein
MIHDAAMIARLMIHGAAGIVRIAGHDAAMIGRWMIHDAWVGRGTTPAMPGMGRLWDFATTWHHRDDE